MGNCITPREPGLAKARSSSTGSGAMLRDCPLPEEVGLFSRHWVLPRTGIEQAKTINNTY
jgi:hypothetical protein